MSDLPKLKPCPFCGSENIKISAARVSSMVWAECERCNAYGPNGGVETEADWAWGEDNNKNGAIPAAIRNWNDRVVYDVAPDLPPELITIKQKLKEGI